MWHLVGGNWDQAIDSNQTSVCVAVDHFVRSSLAENDQHFSCFASKHLRKPWPKIKLLSTLQVSNNFGYMPNTLHNSLFCTGLYGLRSDVVTSPLSKRHGSNSSLPQATSYACVALFVHRLLCYYGSDIVLRALGPSGSIAACTIDTVKKCSSLRSSESLPQNLAGI